MIWLIIFFTIIWFQWFYIWYNKDTISTIIKNGLTDKDENNKISHNIGMIVRNFKESLWIPIILMVLINGLITTLINTVITLIN